MAADDLRLRPYQPADIDPLCKAVLASKRELSVWMAWCHAAYDRTDATEWVDTRPQAWELGIERSFVIEDVADEDMLGGCGLHRIDQANGVAEAGYWVRTSATGRGVATRSLRSLVNWAFSDGGLHRIEIITSVENLASQRVAEKAGAVREALLRSRIQLNGRRHDCYLYAILKS